MIALSIISVALSATVASSYYWLYRLVRDFREENARYAAAALKANDQSIPAATVAAPKKREQTPEQKQAGRLPIGLVN